MPNIVVGRSEEDKEEHGLEGTGVIGKHLVGEDEEAHTANPLHFDVAKPHVVGVFGKRGTGKCLLPDEKVLTEKGLEKIEEVFERGREKGSLKKLDRDEQLYKCEELNVQSIDGEFKNQSNGVKAVYRKRVSEELFRVKTSSGRKVTVTLEHPLLTSEGWKDAGELEEGELIGVPRELDMDFKDQRLEKPESFEEADYSNRNWRESELLESEGGDATKLSDGTGSFRRVLQEAENKDLIHLNEGMVQITEKGQKELKERQTDQHYRLGKSTPIKVPEKVSQKIGEFLAFLLAEGHEQKVTNGNYRLMFTNTDQSLIDRFRRIGKELFDLEFHKMSEDTVYANSTALEEFLDVNGYSVCENSFNKEIPDFILTSSEETAVVFLKRYFESEANVTDQQIDLVTASKDIANALSYMLLRFGIVTRINQKEKYASNTEEKRVRSYYQLTISGSGQLEKFRDKIGFSVDRKSEKLSSTLNQSNTNVDVVECGNLLKECREKMGANRIQVATHKQSLKAYEDGKYKIGREKLGEIIENLESYLEEISRMKKQLDDQPTIEKVESFMEKSNVLWKELNKQQGYDRSDRRILTYKKYQKNPEKLAESVLSIFNDKNDLEEARNLIKKLQDLACSDVFWDEIEEIKEIDYEGWVYDLTVRENHSFTAGLGGVFCHNSYSMGTLVEECQQSDVSENISTIMIDPMGIFWSMKRPNERDVSMLDKWDMKPEAFDAQVYIPKGKTRDFDEKEMPYDDTFTLNPAQLTSEEWRMAFGLDSNTEMSILLERMCEDLTDEFGDEYRIKHMKKALEKYEFPEKTKRGLENRLRNAEDWGVFGEESSIDKLTEAGELSIVDVSVFGQLSGGTRVQALVVAILAKRILRRRMAARRLEELDEMQGLDRADEPIQWMLIDEAHEYLPAEGETPATNPLLRWVKIGREPGVSLVLCTQQPAKLHPNALSQMDLLLAHRLTAQQDIDALQEIMQTYMRYDLRHYIDALPDRPGTAMIMDDNSERAYPAQMRPRKSWHAGGTPDAFD